MYLSKIGIAPHPKTAMPSTIFSVIKSVCYSIGELLIYQKEKIPALFQS